MLFLSLVAMKELLARAEEKGVAIGAFSVGNMEMVMGAVKAAEELETPIILQIAEVRLKSSPLELMGPMMLAAAENASVDIAVHLDHGLNVETVEQALDIGFTSVMLDGSLLPLEENIKTVKGVVETAKEYDATVEAELGVVGGNEGEGKSHKILCTNPDDAKRFCDETGVDALAVAIGNAHGNYPVLPELSRGESFEISEPLLKSVIGQTLYAVATIDTKPVLMGSKFEIKNNELNVISVDGIRIAIRKESLLHEDFDFVVPAKTLSELLRLLSDDESKIATVSVDRNQGIFSIDKYTVFSRLLEGDFFDYTKIIGMPSNIEAVVNVRELMECVDRTLLLLNDKIKSPVDFTFSDNTLRVFCETAIGKLDQKIKCDYSGEEFRISFNSRYILDALKNTYCDKVKFLFVQNTALKIVPLEGDSFTFIVSPVRRR